MVQLIRMTQPELDEYLPHAIQALADELAKGNGWNTDQSLAAALRSFDVLLPNRAVDSPNQLLWTIVADSQRVGVLWCGIREHGEAFVWDILIYPAWRNRGYGTEAMVAMEQELRQMEIVRVGLNVFAHNSVAARMYSKIGYIPVSTRLIKVLDRKDF